MGVKSHTKHETEASQFPLCASTPSPPTNESYCVPGTVLHTGARTEQTWSCPQGAHTGSSAISNCSDTAEKNAKTGWGAFLCIEVGKGSPGDRGAETTSYWCAWIREGEGRTVGN
jgi:hypothetical protein